jgi:hypothetical protein
MALSERVQKAFDDFVALARAQRPDLEAELDALCADSFGTLPERERPYLNPEDTHLSGIFDEVTAAWPEPATREEEQATHYDACELWHRITGD